MNIQTKWIIALFAVCCSLACESDDDTSESTEKEIIVSGTADFSIYVALGNSLAAGYTDGALFKAGQDHSLPNILSGQFALAGGGKFTQPITNDNIGGITLGGNIIGSPRLYFYSDPNPEPPNESGPRVLDAIPTTEVSALVTGPFNNLGVPGAKSYHLLAEGYGNVSGVATGQANPYFARMASSSNASVLGDALVQNPTFFTLWIGNNDVLGYALSGGDDSDAITDITLFTQAYTGLVNGLTENGASGVLYSIPNITTIPHFTTVPYNPVPMDEATATQVNQGYANYNGGLIQVEGLGAISAEERVARTIVFKEGTNAVVIVDEDLTDLSAYGLPKYRQATKEDLLILPSSSFIGTAVDNDPAMINGVSVPLEDKWVLVASEQQNIADATMQFNAVIKGAVDQNDLAFVDAAGLLEEIDNGGITFDDFELQSNLVFGGAFSLDGVHPTARGYAYLANKTLEVINARYGANLPLVKAVDYPLFYSEKLR
ncbi:G-D-S-L family lipolytic protein [Aquimarina sp. 2-A2]|uniref:G-D-S-L family lipolytic protein n=1 Tax=Aquimarina sp. 2-A2 TaxID=3382644 RepID=UPI00387F014F